jgi:hypothetical protein
MACRDYLSTGGGSWLHSFTPPSPQYASWNDFNFPFLYRAPGAAVAGQASAGGGLGTVGLFFFM